MDQIIKRVKPLCVIFLFLLVAACATPQPVAPIGHGVDPLRQSPQVLFRDLTLPAEHIEQRSISK